MTKFSTITVIGKDKTGVVARRTGFLFEQKANIEGLEEQVTRGQFSMTVQVSWRDGQLNRAAVVGGLELLARQREMHITPGNKRGHMQTKLRNLRSGSQTEYRFRSEDSVDRVSLEQREMEYLYAGDGFHYFMNTETYEQLPLSDDTLGDAVRYLTPNLRIQVEFHDENPLGVELPKTVDLRITETTPGLKGATVTNVLKPATTETGLVVQVPSFVSGGETIRVATETGEYVSRVKS